jgi:hypothetical protein
VRERRFTMRLAGGGFAARTICFNATQVSWERTTSDKLLITAVANSYSCINQGVAALGTLFFELSCATRHE